MKDLASTSCKPNKNPFRDYVRKQRLKKYLPLMAVCLLIGIWYVLIGNEILPEFVQGLGRSNEQTIVKQYCKAPCSEANLTRMIAITYGKTEKIEDQSVGALWYEPYYKTTETLGIKALDIEDAFQLIGYEKLSQVLKQLFKDIDYSDVLKEQEHYQIYEVIHILNEVGKRAGKQAITYQEMAILKTSSEQEDLAPWEAITDEGNFYFEGLVVEPLKHQTIQFAVCENQILGAIEVIEPYCLLKDCKVLSVENVSDDTQTLQSQATIQIGELSLDFKNEALTKAQENSSLTLKLQSGCIIGYETSSLEAVQENTVMSAGATSQKIRVLLTDSKGNYIHNDVTLQSAKETELMINEKPQTLEAQKPFEAAPFFKTADQEKVILTPKEEGELTLTSVTKAGASPSYKGSLEITKVEDGFIVINEVGIEDYVAGVIPSEMPTSFEKEALKAQAVAARTYGVSAIGSRKFKDYGADVDDTTASQVYNRIGADEASQLAAKETQGLVLKSNDKYVSNKFFSTSCGYTANYGEVWAGSQFPSQTPSYLVASQQFTNKDLPTQLSQEADFKHFIKLGADDLEAYDEASPWFRWQVNLDQETLAGLIKPALKQLAPDYPSLIKYDKKGEVLNQHVEDIGLIYNLEVKKRGSGGNAMILFIDGEKANVTVSTEYLIRSLFKSNDEASLNVTRADQTEVKALSLLPSAFFYVEQEENPKTEAISKLTLYGGGNGHGVGLSQEGANGMAKLGYDYKEILANYYKDAQLVPMN